MNSLKFDRPLSIVNFRRYVGPRDKPVNTYNIFGEAVLDAQLGMIKDASPRRLIFREIARRLRVDSKV